MRRKFHFNSKLYRTLNKAEDYKNHGRIDDAYKTFQKAIDLLFTILDSSFQLGKSYYNGYVQDVVDITHVDYNAVLKVGNVDIALEKLQKLSTYQENAVNTEQSQSTNAEMVQTNLVALAQDSATVTNKTEKQHKKSEKYKRVKEVLNRFFTEKKKKDLLSGINATISCNRSLLHTNSENVLATYTPKSLKHIIALAVSSSKPTASKAAVNSAKNLFKLSEINKTHQILINYKKERESILNDGYNALQRIKKMIENLEKNGDSSASQNKQTVNPLVSPSMSATLASTDDKFDDYITSNLSPKSTAPTTPSVYESLDHYITSSDWSNSSTAPTTPVSTIHSTKVDSTIVSNESKSSSNPTATKAKSKSKNKHHVPTGLHHQSIYGAGNTIAHSAKNLREFKAKYNLCTGKILTAFQKNNKLIFKKKYNDFQNIKKMAENLKEEHYNNLWKKRETVSQQLYEIESFYNILKNDGVLTK